MERDHKNCQLIIFPPSDEVITVKYFRENAKPLAELVFVQPKQP